MALFYFLRGLRLDEAWDNLCKRFGYHQDIAYSLEFFGSEGQAKMDNLMNVLHNNPFIEINGLKVVAVDDIEKQLHIDANGKTSPINLPKANVVKLFLEDGSLVTVRPSGTEPKVKFYVGTKLKDKPKDNSFPEALYKGIKEVLHL
jgi:phosphoglucomutase